MVMKNLSMSFLETVEKNKENFLKEEKKRYNKKITLETKCLKEYWDSLSIEEKKNMKMTTFGILF